jgi:integrase
LANLGRKGEIYVARFRWDGKEYKKSLKTTNLADARAALKAVERTIHGLTTGLIQVPDRVDPGDFILSGGKRTEGKKPRRPPLTLAALIDAYLTNQSHKAASSVVTERIHLNNFKSGLGRKADSPIERIECRDLESYLQARLKERTAVTVHKERGTIRQLFRWAVAQKFLDDSPAEELTPIKEAADLPPFRTSAEIEAALSRGGLSEAEIRDIWDCLFLTPAEIADLLQTVRVRAECDFAFLLHAIPAYSGMRRGEVLRLRWTDVELDQGYLVARSRKQSRRVKETVRRIDLHPELEQELRRWKDLRPGGQFVVCRPDSFEPLDRDLANRAFWQPMRGTAWCLDSRKNWFKVGFHTYRHSFASNLASLGVDQRIIDEWMGHQTEAMRKRYRHLFPRVRRSAIESFTLAGPAITD